MRIALQARKRDDLQIADPRTNLIRHGLRQGAHYRIGHLIARAETRNGRCWKFRISEAALGRDDFNWPRQPLIHRNMAMHGGIKQH